MANLNNPKKAQSIIEYICVTLVFMAVGVATFLATNRMATTNLRGQRDSFRSQDTMMGKTFASSPSEQTYVWPSTWGAQAASTSNYEGAVSAGQIADAKGTTVGQPRGELYKYEPVNWAVYNDVPYDNGLSGGQNNGE